jgi:hypothetical protein
MSQLTSYPDGGYRYIPSVFQYSAGVTAAEGFTIERARLREPKPLPEGFAMIEAHLGALGRPVAALCACELRSPAPFTENGFITFNRQYVAPLERWNIIQSGVNPIARTNVCPEILPPATVVVYAFSYTVLAPSAPPSFVIAGSGEAPEGKGNYRDHAIRLGDCSTHGLREKARWVLEEMERRMQMMGFSWKDATGTHLYTVHDVHPFLADELAARGAMQAGLTWHFARPPVRDLEYEMDVRGVTRKIVL